MRHTTTTDTSFEIAKWLGGAAAGALLMYMLDPDRGSARRAQSAAAVRNAGSRTSSALGNAWHSAGERIGSAGERLRHVAADAAETVAEKVKPDGAAGSALARMGQAASEAYEDAKSGARSSMSRGGDVVNEGIERAEGALSRAAHAIEDRYEDARSGARRFGARVKGSMQAGPQGEWAPGMRNSALAGGSMLAAYGLLRRSPLALVLGLAGAALLARGAANKPLTSMMRGRNVNLGMDQTIDFEKSIHIDASPEEVYDAWTNYENFPRFMSHVVEVRDLGRRRSHWVVKGPGGSEFEWNSVLTEQSRPHRLAWRSEPGAEIPQSGSVQFEPHRGGTHVTVRMSYTPPAGALGHGLATLLGSDPKSRMDDDLARMKSFIERGVLPRDAAQSRSSSRFLH